MFRFSIRDVLWLTVVVGLALGWWLCWRNMPRSGTALVGAVSILGAPLADGRVCIQSPEGQIVGVMVSKGGYRIPNVPVGSYEVTIEGSGVAWRYRYPKSVLKIQVKEGTNRVDIDLIPYSRPN